MFNHTNNLNAEPCTREFVTEELSKLSTREKLRLLLLLKAKAGKISFNHNNEIIIH